MSSAMDAESKEMLREWLVRSLEPVCDADPEVLSKYVLALIQNDPKKDGLRDTCVAKLDEFLGDETAPFVGRLFTALETDSYRKDSKTNHDDGGRQSGGGGGGAENSGRYSRGEEENAQRRPLPHHQHQQQQQPDGSRRRARGASDEDDDAEHGRYGKQRRRGEEDGGRHGSPRRGGDREREDRRHRTDGHGGGRDGGRSGGRGGARDWDRERGGNGGGGAYPPPGDRRRNFPPEWGMPPPGMWPPHHGYAPPPRGGAGAFPGPPHHLMGEFDPNAYNPENPGMMPHPMSMMMGGRGGYYPPYGGRGGGRGGRSGYNGGRGGPMGMGGPMGKSGDDGSGMGAEAMAKTTLRVSNVDPKYVNMTKLSLHFSKFGNVVNVQMRPQHKCAYVQYATEDEANKAFHSPMPVCNNRFIEVKWARYDPKDPHGAPSSTDESGEPKNEGASATAGEGGDADTTTTEGGADETATNGQATTPHDANAERNMTPEELRAAALEKGRRVLEEKRELLEKQKQLMKQKEELLKRQLAQQKELLERMSQNPTAVSAADKRELLNKITALSEELKALQPQPQNKLSGLKAELSALEEAASSAGGGRGRGRGGAAAVGGRWGASQAGGRGFYGRGAGGGRGGRGAGRAFSNTLDNRTTIVKVENLPEEARDPSVLEQHFGNFGGIERVVMEGADRGFIKFQDRYAGQNALLRGGTFGQARLQLSWAEAQDAPAELAPATPSSGDAQGDGGAEYATESSEVSASA